MTRAKKAQSRQNARESGDLPRPALPPFGASRQSMLCIAKRKRWQRHLRKQHVHPHEMPTPLCFLSAGLCARVQVAGDNKAGAASEAYVLGCDVEQCKARGERMPCQPAQAAAIAVNRMPAWRRDAPHAAVHAASRRPYTAACCLGSFFQGS